MRDRKSGKANHLLHEQQEKHPPPPQQQHPNGHLSPFKLAKLFDPDASWDKDQLGDVLHWIRQVVALLCGLLWGAIPLVGGIWIIFMLVKLNSMKKMQNLCMNEICPVFLVSNVFLLFPLFTLFLGVIDLFYLHVQNSSGLKRFLVLSSGIIYAYYAMILKVDEEEFGGHGALLQEGLFASFTLFLLAWILVYSLAHF